MTNKKDQQRLQPVDPLAHPPKPEEVEKISQEAYQDWEKKEDAHQEHLEEAAKHLEQKSRPKVPPTRNPSAPIEPDVPADISGQKSNDA